MLLLLNLFLDYFIPFYIIISRIVFISLLDYPLLVKKEYSYFGKLILYPTTWLNLYINSNSFSLDFLGLSTHMIMSSVNGDRFTFSCPIWMPFLSFSCLTFLASPSSYPNVEQKKQEETLLSYSFFSPSISRLTERDRAPPPGSWDAVHPHLGPPWIQARARVACLRRSRGVDPEPPHVAQPRRALHGYPSPTVLFSMRRKELFSFLTQSCGFSLMSFFLSRQIPSTPRLCFCCEEVLHCCTGFVLLLFLF